MNFKTFLQTIFTRRRPTIRGSFNLSGLRETVEKSCEQMTENLRKRSEEMKRDMLINEFDSLYISCKNDENATKIPSECVTGCGYAYDLHDKRIPAEGVVVAIPHPRALIFNLKRLTRIDGQEEVRYIRAAVYVSPCADEPDAQRVRGQSEDPEFDGDLDFAKLMDLRLIIAGIPHIYHQEGETTSTFKKYELVTERNAPKPELSVN